MCKEQLQKDLGEPSSASSEARRARARVLFVAALAEWVNMHDHHKPYPLGPPGKDQSCAHVEHEHSTMEKVDCNKQYPRKLIEAGKEEVAEDPRRHDLYSLWMARNCHFLNNFVPLVILGLLSNMDFQAVLSKDAVTGYMTKYFTKSGQGALISNGDCPVAQLVSTRYQLFRKRSAAQESKIRKAVQFSIIWQPGRAMQQRTAVEGTEPP